MSQKDKLANTNWEEKPKFDPYTLMQETPKPTEKYYEPVKLHRTFKDWENEVAEAPENDPITPNFTEFTISKKDKET